MLKKRVPTYLLHITGTSLTLWLFIKLLYTLNDEHINNLKDKDVTALLAKLREDWRKTTENVQNGGIALQRYDTCLGKTKWWKRRGKKKKCQTEPSATFLWHGLGSRGYTSNVCAAKLREKERERHYFHFYSRAAQHPPQSARWPKPCANPRSCSLMCPRKHTHTHTE